MIEVHKVLDNYHFVLSRQGLTEEARALRVTIVVFALLACFVSALAGGIVAVVSVRYFVGEGVSVNAETKATIKDLRASVYQAGALAHDLEDFK